MLLTAISRSNRVSKNRRYVIINPRPKQLSIPDANCKFWYVTETAQHLFKSPLILTVGKTVIKVVGGSTLC